MGFIVDALTEWLKELLVGGIISNLSGMFDSVNQKVGEIAGQVGTTPQAWNSGIYNMIRNLSETVILPIAGVILAFVMTLELIQLMPTAVTNSGPTAMPPAPKPAQTRPTCGRWKSRRRSTTRSLPATPIPSGSSAAPSKSSTPQPRPESPRRIL